MARFRFKIEGFEALRIRLQKTLPAAIAERAEEAIRIGAVLIEGNAKRRAPVRTGRLRASITHQVQRTPAGSVALVGTNVDYAPFVEFGTGPSGAGSPLSQTAIAYMRDVGYVHGSGPRPGMPAQPFLFPAFEAVRPDIVGEIEKAIREATQRS
jgi:HK97 gp10 family phage protein